MYQALLFPSPHEACASPYAGKRGTGDEAICLHACMSLAEVAHFSCLVIFFPNYREEKVGLVHTVCARAKMGYHDIIGIFSDI